MKLRKISPILALILGCAITPVHSQAQQPQENAPQGPIQPVPSDTGDENRQMPTGAARGLSPDDQDQTGNNQAETGVLAGVESFGIQRKTDLFDPAVFGSAAGQTGVTQGQTNLVVSVGGSLALIHSWDRYQFSTEYQGAETVYYPAAFDNFSYHSLSISQAIQLRRATFKVLDDFLYSPAASFGGLNIGGAALQAPVAVLSNVNPSLAPSETIATGQSNRISNTTLGELDYSLSRRSTLTFAGGYGFIHFVNAGFIDNHNIDGRLGVSYDLNRKDSVGIIYDYQDILFPQAHSSTSSHAIQAAYARRLSGRLAFRLAGGPQFISPNNLGPGGASLWSLSVNTSLAYQRARTNYSASYSYGLNGGSGVFQGARTHTVFGNIQRTMMRTWSASLIGGFALSTTLLPNANVGNFTNWYVGASLGHRWGKFVQGTFSYEYQRQTTTGSCPVVSCGLAPSSQLFGATIQVHLKPIVLD